MVDSSDEAEFNDEVMEEEEEEEDYEPEDEGQEAEEEDTEGRQPRAARKSLSYAEDEDDDDDDDSDDDIPLAVLAAKAKKEKKKAAATSTTKKKSSSSTSNDKKSPVKKTVAKKKKPPSAPARSSSNVSNSSAGNKKYEFASAALYQTESLKGLLIQRLLCRWWYAYQWPDPTLLPNKPPKNYDALDGFPGVYVCTQGDNVGKLKDLRNMDQCPSFRNFVHKPAAELQELLLKALENQKAQLIQHDGPESASSAPLKELDSLIKWTKKVDPKKAEKEMSKVLKASNLTL